MESFQNSTTNILGNLSDTHSSSVSISLFVALLCICIVIGHLLGESRWMNESIASLFIGLASGAIVLFISKGKSSHILVFNEELFFIYLLPPIIFNAGFQVKKKRFFLNFATIVLFGAVGTFVSFIIISLGTKLFIGKYFIKSLTIGDCLALGTIFSATDSVCTLQVLNQEQTPLLYSLVFGEGVVNDATSIVLFNAVQAYDLSNINIETTLKILGNFIYLYLTSTILGIIAGLLSAYVIKKLCFGRHSTDREIAIMILMAYLSYTLAELFALSGILTVFFCGIVMSHYTWHNVTESSRITTKHTFATMSFISEVFIFLYVGMDAVDIDKWRLLNISSGTFVVICTIMLGLVLLGRAAFVFPISCLSNGFRKSPSNKISFRQQVIIWWAGLMRGAVSMALAYNQFSQSGETKLPDHALIITSTIVVVVISTTVFGLMTKPMIHLILHQKQTIDIEILSSLDLHRPLVENAVDPSTSDTHSSRYTVRDLWHKVDDGFMRPMFGGRGFATLRPGSPVEGGRS